MFNDLKIGLQVSALRAPTIFLTALFCNFFVHWILINILLLTGRQVFIDLTIYFLFVLDYLLGVCSNPKGH
jgi:hypothetical protein